MLVELVSCERYMFPSRSRACEEAEGPHHIIEFYSILEAERIKLFIRCKNVGVAS